jgi:hypothetical protein
MDIHLGLVCSHLTLAAKPISEDDYFALNAEEPVIWRLVRHLVSAITKAAAFRPASRLSQQTA